MSAAKVLIKSEITLILEIFFQYEDDKTGHTNKKPKHLYIHK